MKREHLSRGGTAGRAPPGAGGMRRDRGARAGRRRPEAHLAPAEAAGRDTGRLEAGRKGGAGGGLRRGCRGPTFGGGGFCSSRGSGPHFQWPISKRTGAGSARVLARVSGAHLRPLALGKTGPHGCCGPATFRPLWPVAGSRAVARGKAAGPSCRRAGGSCGRDGWGSVPPGCRSGVRVRAAGPGCGAPCAAARRRGPAGRDAREWVRETGESGRGFSRGPWRRVEQRRGSAAGFSGGRGAARRWPLP